MLCTFPLLMKRYPKNCVVTLVFLLQLNKRFNLSFLNVHGKLFTKVGCVLEVQYILYFTWHYHHAVKSSRMIGWVFIFIFFSGVSPSQNAVGRC